MRRAAAIYLIVLACYALTAGGHLYSPDEELVFRTARSLATEGSLAIEPLSDDPNAVHFGTRKPARPRPDGREYAQYGIGQPILAVPFYWLGAGLSHFGGDAFWQRMTGGREGLLPADETAPRWACSWFNVFLGPLLAVMIYLIALEIGAVDRGASIASLLYAFGTLAWPHSRPFFTESCAALFILFSWWALLKSLNEKPLVWCLLAGSAAGYAALVRMDSVAAYPALAVLLVFPVLTAAKDRARSFFPAWIAFALPAAMCGAIFLGLNRIHFGGATQTGYADQPEGLHFSSPFIPGIYGLLFSAGKGLFFFSPALVLSFFGWRPLIEVLRSARERTIRVGAWPVWSALLATILVPLCLHAKWPNWAGGWCWGPRHIFLIHPFLALPIAAWLSRCWNSAVRIAIACFFVAGAGVQLLGCSQDFISFYGRFFRHPGDRSAYYVLYDPLDREYWSQYYDLRFHPSPTAPLNPFPLAPPAPTQSSVFDPQHSVWAGYPVMLREGEFDNFWVNFIRYESVPAAQSLRPNPAGDPKP